MSASLNERLNAILPKVISDAFLSGSGIGNEIAFYIFDYPPEDELRVRDYLRTLLDHIPKQKHGLRVTHIDLFDFVMDYLTRRTLLDKALQMQREQGDQALKRGPRWSVCTNPSSAQCSRRSPHRTSTISSSCPVSGGRGPWSGRTRC